MKNLEQFLKRQRKTMEKEENKNDFLKFQSIETEDSPSMELASWI